MTPLIGVYFISFLSFHQATTAFHFLLFIRRQTTGKFKPVFLPVMFINEVRHQAVLLDV